MFSQPVTGVRVGHIFLIFPAGTPSYTPRSPAGFSLSLFAGLNSVSSGYFWLPLCYIGSRTGRSAGVLFTSLLLLLISVVYTNQSDEIGF
jgi:hypothetical protein